MSISGSHRNSLVVIPFLQKRLRRITSIGLHNLTVNERHFTVYFTLHRFHRRRTTSSSAFFTSESLQNERNPEWSSFEFPEDAQCLQEFQIYFWVNARIFLQYDIFLDDSLLPDVQKTFVSFGSNCFWLEMFGYRFSDVPNAGVSPPSIDLSRLPRVKSYDRSSVLRIFNLTEAIRNEEQLAAKCLRDVETLIEKRQEILSKIRERESRQVRLKNLHQCLTSRISANRQRSNLLREREKVLDERRKFLEFYRSRLILQSESIDDLFGYVEQSRSDLRQLEEMIDQRRKDLLKDVSNYIYPIEMNAENQWTIVRAKLPPANNKIFQSSSIRDKEIAGALVFSSHLILLISHIIDLPLRYPIDYFADGTIRIYDFTLEIHQFLLDPPVDPNAFRYAFYLLNRNLGQILFHCRIPTRRVDFRRTLENFKLFFEQFVQI